MQSRTQARPACGAGLTGVPNWRKMIEIPAWALGTILALVSVVSYMLGWYGTFDGDDERGA